MIAAEVNTEAEAEAKSEARAAAEATATGVPPQSLAKIFHCFDRTDGSGRLVLGLRLFALSLSVSHIIGA